MVKKWSHILCAAVCAIILASCTREITETPGIRRVFLMYSAAFSNLSSNIHNNEEQLIDGELPMLGSDDVLLIYSHHTSQSGVYAIPTNPILCRVFKGPMGEERKDTLIVYPETDISASPQTLRKVLTDVQELFPADKYGLLLTSHGKGWIPPGYTENNSIIFDSAKSTKELGIEMVDGSGIDVRDLPGAIPMHLEFFIMDACLMGCVEVAYELKDKCDYLVFSPTEILSYGMVYTPMLKRLLWTGKADLQAVCEDYMAYYKSQSGSYQSATITLVDLKGMDALAAACAPLTAKYRHALDNLDRSKIQPYFYNDLHWFYDLRDIFVQAGISQAELESLDSALEGCVLYKGATESFFGLKMERICGLSSYIPMKERDALNEYYKTLSWNKAIGLIQ
ncbi:MAG: hypothetical protein J5640_01015 [Bacteroidales bacterium]|nr:hypothetical protein [Bacteroidales bacterium]